MKIIDTVVLIASFDPQHPLYGTAILVLVPEFLVF
jgi:hypothetical protein